MASLKDLNVQFGEYVQLDELQEPKESARARAVAIIKSKKGEGKLGLG